MKTVARLSVLVLALGAAGCGKQVPTQFYTLSAVGSGATLSGKFQPATIGDVTLPSVLDRQQIVRQADENQIVIADEARWAAPLDEMTRRTIQRDMEGMLPDGALIVGDAAANDPKIAVVDVEVDKFISDTAGHVELDAHWSVVKGDPSMVILRSSAQISRTAANSGFPAMADAMSHAAAELASRIAASLPRQ